MYTDLEQIADI